MLSEREPAVVLSAETGAAEVLGDDALAGQPVRHDRHRRGAACGAADVARRARASAPSGCGPPRCGCRRRSGSRRSWTPWTTAATEMWIVMLAAGYGPPCASRSRVRPPDGPAAPRVRQVRPLSRRRLPRPRPPPPTDRHRVGRQAGACEVAHVSSKAGRSPRSSPANSTDAGSISVDEPAQRRALVEAGQPHLEHPTPGVDLQAEFVGQGAPPAGRTGAIAAAGSAARRACTTSDSRLSSIQTRRRSARPRRPPRAAGPATRGSSAGSASVSSRRRARSRCRTARRRAMPGHCVQAAEVAAPSARPGR